MNKINRGSLSFGMQVLLLILAVFILWTLFGNKQNGVNQNSTNKQKDGSFYQEVDPRSYAPELPTAGY